jgi:tRNA G18 (ribose-2'-O)-methylase SpoU
MPVFVDSLDDPRLEAYRHMKDKELARDGLRFIAEGEHVVRRLLASGLCTESVLVARRKADAIAPLVPAATPLWVADDDMIERTIGFEFHSGVLACGIRPPSLELDRLLSLDAATVVVCPLITNVQNLGSLIRISAAFGASAMILGERCCDPFFRQSVRVSMGTVFKLPFRRSADLVDDLNRLGRSGYERVATVLAPDAQALATARRREKLALLLGGEADGLEKQFIELCDRRCTIPMRHGTDSLNVAVAAGIFLYHFVDVCAAAQAVRSSPSA